MNIKIIKNDKEHEEMMGEFDKLLEIVMKKGEENTDREILDQMELLAIVIEKYEEKRWPIGSEPDPISMIKFIMEQKELRATDMKEYFDGKTSRFYEVINHKRKLSLNMIKKLHEGLGIPYDCLIA